MGLFGFPREDEFDWLIQAAASRYGVPWELVKAVIAQESGFNPGDYRPEPSLTQSDGSRGLMQLILSTARGQGFTGPVEKLLDPATSIEYGTKYLAYQWRRYGGNPADTYAAYNAGTAFMDAEGYYTNSKGDRSVTPRVRNVLKYFDGYRGASGTLPPASGMEGQDTGEVPSSGAKVVGALFDDVSQAAAGVASWLGSWLPGNGSAGDGHTDDGGDGSAQPGAMSQAVGGILGIPWSELAIAGGALLAVWALSDM